MVESGTVFTIIKGVRENWDLLLKILHIPRKKVAEPTYDEASFLALLEGREKESVRHVDSRRHPCEFRAYVDGIVFERRLMRNDSNMLTFSFSKEVDWSDGLRNQQFASFGKALRAKAKMLKLGDHILIRGYFSLGPVFPLIYISDIERL